MFVVGAAFGRLMGEIIAAFFPDGIPGGTDQVKNIKIVPK
jgi:hypothetical protein